MTDVWITIVVLAAATILIKAVGPVTLGGRELPPRVAAVVALFAPALLAALVVVETFSDEKDLIVDERVLGVAVAGAAYAWRRSMLLAVVLAPIVTAVARQLIS